MEKSYSKLILGVRSYKQESDALKFMKFFDSEGITGEKSDHKTLSFIEIFRYIKHDDEDDKIKEEFVAGITLLGINLGTTSIEFDALLSAKRIFSDAVHEYKSFLNKSKTNDTFNLEPQLILVGEVIE